MKPIRQSIEALEKKSDFDEFLLLRMGRKYVPAGNPDDGEVCLEENEIREEKV